MLNRRNVLKSLAALPFVGYIPASKAVAGPLEWEAITIVYNVEHLSLEGVKGLIFARGEYNNAILAENVFTSPVCQLHEGETFQSVFNKFMEVCGKKTNRYYHIIDKKNSLYCLVGSEDEIVHRIGSTYDSALSEDEIKKFSLELMKEKING